MSLARQIWVVLLSYLTRTGFRWAIVSGLFGFSLMLIGAGWGSLLHLNPLNENPFEFLFTIGVMAISASLFAALIIFFVHARQQLMGPTTRFIPNTRRANLIVAAGLLFAIVLAISWTIHDVDFFPGTVLVVLFFMTLIACAVCNPWLVPLPVAAMPLLVNNMETQLAASRITQEWNLAMLNILLLIALERLSRPKRAGTSREHLARKLSAIFERASYTSPAHRHPFIQTRFARIAHRRFAVHDGRAVVFLAGLIGVLAAMTCYFASPHDPLISIVAMLAVLPGALTAIGWRNRWGSYDFETLYPAKNQQFVSEMLIVLLLDMVEYWFAGLAAMLLTILAMRPQMFHESEFWTTISGAAMMQVLWIGGIALAGQRRQTLPFAAGLGIAMLAMLLAFDDLRRADFLLYRSHFIAFATIEMLVGFLFLAIATLAWRRRATA